MFNQNLYGLPMSLAVGSAGELMMPAARRHADASKAVCVFAQQKRPAHLAMRGPLFGDYG
jgi:hypothetical protein